MKLTPLTLWLATAVLVALSILFAAPFVWMLSTSLKVEEKIQSAETEVVPRAMFLPRDGREVRVKPTMVKDGLLEVQVIGDADNKPTGETLRVDPADLRERVFLNTYNYTDALNSFPFGRYLFNTLVICAISVTGTVLSCSLVAYGLACVPWRGREVLFWVMLATMMLPGQVTMIPLFLTFKQLGWINTILPLTVPAFLGNAFFVFLLRQFYRSIPPDLLDAARIDGASDLRIWGSIMLPLSRPALGVVALFTFLGSWNDFLGPLIYLVDDSKYTLSIGLTMFQGQYGGEWGQMMAMSLLMTLPIIVLFFFMQRSFIQGVKLAGIKG
jgi:multiple sugar transport system permease protein